MESTPIVFRPLHLELESGLAGQYDGSQVDVSFAAVKQMVVSYHEAVHERLTFSTPDGALAGLCLSTKGLPPIFMESAPAWLEQSLVPHEAAATYLSIKTFAPEAQAALIDQLPSEYKGYYALMADAIDGVHARSSYLQYLVGLSLAAAAFRSEFIIGFVRADWSKVLARPPEFRPDVRLRRQISALASTAGGEIALMAQRAADEACRAAGVAPWDMQSEEEWVQNLANSKIVEPAILPILTRELARAAGLTVIETEPETAAYSELARKLAEFGVNLQVRSRGTTHAEAVESELRIGAYHQAESVVSNPAAGTVEQSEDSALELPVMLDPRYQMAIHSVLPGSSSRLWAFLIIATDPASGARSVAAKSAFTHEATLGWLRRREAAQRAGKPVPAILAMTVGVASPAELDDLVRELKDAVCPSGEPWPHWADAACCWYLHGNLVKWIAALLPRRPLRVHAFRAQIDLNDPDPRQSPEFGGVGAYMFRAESLPGSLLRLLNLRAFAQADEWVSLAAPDEIVASDEAEQARNGDLFHLVGDQIFAYWPEF